MSPGIVHRSDSGGAARLRLWEAFDPAHVGEMGVYTGHEAQVPDPLMPTVRRGLTYVMMEPLYIMPYSNRLPRLSFQVQA